MSLTYTTYVDQLSNLMVVGSTDTNFSTFLPGCIDYAEQRIYRELDLLNTVVVDTTATITSGSRTLTLPTASGVFIDIQSINAISISSATRNAMTPVSREFIDAVYPNATTTGTPAFFSPLTDEVYYIAPSPAVNFTAEVIGTVRPTALSSGNPSTFLTQYCPDLFMAASMIFATGYQRDFGAEADDPKMGGSWEQQYQALVVSAQAEQLRAKFTPPTRA